MKKFRITILFVIMTALLVDLFVKSPQVSLAATNAQTNISGPVGQNAANWALTFNDEFNGTSLNRTTWRSDYFPNGGNGEMQQYVSDNSHSNYLVQNGALSIIARKESLNGQPYTSGIIHTKSRFLQKYGYFEIRFKAPYGRGFWPAFWLLPDQDNWVPEIDVTEILGHQINTTYMTLHYHNTSGAYVQTQSTYTGPDLSAGYHTFAIDWEPSALVWYVDGVERKRTTDTTAIPNMPLYVIANLAVGGNWPGSPDSNTVFPSNFDIDYIRVWQKSSGTSPTQVAAPTQTQVATKVSVPTQTPVAVISNTPIVNASFENTSVSPWSLRNDLGAAFSQDTTTSANNSRTSLKAVLTSSNSSQPWVVSVSQSNLGLIAGKSYTFSFWAKASAARPIRAIMQEQNSPYTEFTKQTANLSSTWMRYSYTFVAPASTASAMLNLNLADAAGSVWIDEVALCQSGTSCPDPTPAGTNPTATATVPPQPTATRTALPQPTAVVPQPTATLQNTADTTPPGVTLTSPLNNALVKRRTSVTISANASDNIRVAKVDFLVNGNIVCSETAAPYSCVWRVPSARGVSYTIVAKAYDTAQNSSTSTITVKSTR